MKFCLGEARAGREGKGVWGKGIPATPERFLEIGVGIFLKISSDFVQCSEHHRKFKKIGVYFRLAALRLGDEIAQIYDFRRRRKIYKI